MPAWNTFPGSTQLSSTISTSIRASDGFIYLGGSDGLYRIEGVRVREFRPNFFDPEALPAGRVRALANEGQTLWVGTGAGLVRYSPSQDRMERLPLPGTKGRVEVNALAAAPAGLFVGTDKGAFLRSGKVFVPLGFPAAGAGEEVAVNAIVSLRGRTVLATSAGLFEHVAGNRVRPLSSPFDGQEVDSAIFAPDGALWAIGGTMLAGEGGQAASGWIVRTASTTPSLPQDAFTTIAFDPAGRLWVASRTELSRASDPAGSFVKCRRAINGTDADGDMNVIHMSFSLGPYLFAGTSGTGATHAPMTPLVANILPGQPYNPGLPDFSPWNASKRSDGRIVLGTASGLYEETAPGARSFRSLAPGLLGERLIYAALPEQDRVWAGTNGGLFLVSADGSAKEIALLMPGEGAKPVSVFTIKRRNDELLVGSDAGLFILDAGSGAPRRLFRTRPGATPVGNPPISDIPGARIWSLDLLEDVVLAAGDAHVMVIDPVAGKVLATTEAATEADMFVPGRVYAAMREGKDSVLIGTENGLVITDMRFSRFEQIGQINAVTLGSIKALGRGKDGRTWLGVAGNGLFHRMPGEAQWSHIGQSDGLATNGVGQLGLSFADDGSLLVTNGTGAAIVDPALWQTPRPGRKPDVVVIEAQSGAVLNRAKRRIALGPEERDFTIQFAVPEILESGEHLVEYAFAPEGEKARTATIPLGEDLNVFRPAPGTYLLIGRVISAGGQSTNPFAFEIEVRPFWWERRETHVALAALILCFAIWAYRAARRADERRRQLLINERRRIAQSLHDSTLQDIFGALLLSRNLATSSQSEIGADKGAQIAGLLTSATDSLRRSIDINGERQEVFSLSSAIRGLSPPAALAQPVDIDFAEDGRPWAVGSHRAFGVVQIVTEALNNAAKHACATEIRVRLAWSWASLTITISDNGTGFDPGGAAQSAGFGLPGMKTMASAAKLRLTIESQPGAGTKVVLNVPRFVL